MKRKTTYAAEFLICLVIGGVLFALLASIDAYEWFHEMSREYEYLELDEVALVFPVLIVVLSIFSIRRYLDVRRTSRELLRTNKELMESREQVLNLNRAKEDFLSFACHELKAPLNNTIVALQLIGAADSREEVDKYSRLAMESAVSLKNYSNDILDITRSLMGQDIVNSAIFDPCEVLESVTDLARNSSGARGLDVKLTIDSGVPHRFHGYETFFRHVVQNLADNAIKFTEKGGVSIHCGLGSRSVRTLELTVEDTGMGIDEKSLEMIFEPYHQCSVMSSATGVGLGLSIVQKLVEAMSGHITVESVLGKGTTFKVLLPEASG